MACTTVLELLSLRCSALGLLASCDVESWKLLTGTRDPGSAMVQSKDTRLALEVLRVGITDREDSARVASIDMMLAEDSRRVC